MSFTAYKGKRTFGQTKNSPVMEWRWSRSGGEAEQIFHQGPYFHLRDVIAPTLSNDFDSITIQQISGGMYRLTAAQAGDEITELHNVDGSNLSQNTTTNPKVAKQFADAGISEENYVKVSTEIVSIIRRLGHGIEYNEVEGLVRNLILSIINDGVAAEPAIVVALNLAQNLAKWGEQFLNAQYCYSHTLSISERIFISGGVFDHVFKNTHKIFTEAQMRSAESIPDSTELPPHTTDPTKRSEWLKQPARSRLIAGQRREIVTSYLAADSWDRFKYGLAE